MEGGRPSGRGSDRPRRRRRGPVPNQEGLAALARLASGEQVPSGPRRGPRPEPPDGAPGAAAPLAADGQSLRTGRVPNENGLRALGERIDAERRRRRRRPRRRLAWALGSVGAVVVVLAGALFGYAWWLDHRIHRVAVGGLHAAPARGVDAGTENILLVGSTSRCALKVQNPAYGLCSQGVTGVNSDVVMILHLNAAKGTASILSIPRDLFVPNARREGANKIDAALAEGPSQLVAAIEEDFAIPIQHYVELNFDTFASVVDALGGIDMYFPEPVYDAYSGLDIRTPGCIHLDGYQALQVVRARHLQYKGPGVTSTNPRTWPQEAQSDLARIRRDHEFLRVLATAVAKQGLGNPFTDQRLVSSVVGDLTVDQGFGAAHMVNLVLRFHSVNANTAPQYTVPVSVYDYQDYVYEGGDYGNIEFPAQPQDDQVVEQFLGLGHNADTMNGGTLPSPGAVTVSVLNGTGAYNQATDTAAALQALGFRIGTLGDTPSPAAQSETVVYYSARTAAEEAAAQAVERSLSGAVIMAYDPTKVPTGSQVAVVTGTTFSVNPPPTPPGTAAPGTGGRSGGAPTTSTPTTSAPASGPFAAPTPPVEQLAPWDPRSCGPHGTPGP